MYLSVESLKRSLKAIQRILRDHRIFYLRKALVFQLSIGDGYSQTPTPKGAITRMANPTDTDKLAKHRGSRYKERIAGKLQLGDLCFLLERNGEILSYLWSSPEKMRIDEVDFTLVWPPEEKSLAVYDVFTCPEHRRRGAYRSLFQGFLEYATSRSYERIYLSIASENLVSRKVHEMLGFQKVVMEITRLIFLGKEWTFVNRKPLSSILAIEGNERVDASVRDVV